MSVHLYDGLGASRTEAEAALADLVSRDAVAKLHARDGSLWSGDPEIAAEIAKWIGWLPVVEEMVAAAPEIAAWAEEAIAPYDRAVLCGMGGSSLAPLVFASVFDASGALEVLDTTDPDAVEAIPVDGSLFVIASKSGSTIEPTVMAEHFWPLVGKDGNRYVAITDPGSKLEAQAKAEGWLRTFTNRADIGGRYSALSYFGLVPAALAGIDVEAVVADAVTAHESQQPGADPEQNLGLLLGAAIGGLANAGRDKLTFIASPPLASVGLWLEQLIAESTGKNGTGVVPLADEPIGRPEVYGDDRVFVHLRADDTHDDAVAAIARSGQPVIVMDVEPPVGIGGLMLTWELATAYMGAVLGINPFDQPNVQQAKDAAVAALAAFDEKGALETVDAGSVADLLGDLQAGQYLVIQAYVSPTVAHEEVLQRVRGQIRDVTHVATAMGFGPRYLHSTGQLHKGGPKEGVFLQVLSGSGSDAEIPGRSHGFRTLIEAQAGGDAAALRAEGRPVARVLLADVSAEVEAALNARGGSR
jgi:transaldolase/glucose-6-phosphate isomerase